MVTPYDWQEGIGHRAQYVESRMSAGVPIAAASIPDGVLVATFRKQASKVYEIYDRLIYSAIGMQSDVENVRVGAIEFCHQEGYQRSEQDVTIQRLVSHISRPLKAAFGDFSTSPIVVRALFAEVADDIENDRYTILEYDGDYFNTKGVCLVAPNEESFLAMRVALEGVDFTKIKQVDALAQLRESVLKGMDPDGSRAAAGEMPELSFEAAIMIRGEGKTRRFQRLGDPLD